MPRTQTVEGAKGKGIASSMLTRAEAASFLRVSPGTLSRWAADRRGPRFVKLCDGGTGSVRYRRDDLEQFIADCTKEPK